MVTKTKEWYQLDNENDLVSPSLLLYPDRIKKNIELMIAMAGGVDNLRPHIKTHKIAELIAMQISSGIYKFKCATIAEAELLAKCKAKDVLLAMQPVGANVGRYISLVKKYPKTDFSTLVDHQEAVEVLSKEAAKNTMQISVWLDLNVGMNRTGILPDKTALDLYLKIAENDNFIAKGLHAYDGHIHDADFEKRKEVCDLAFDKVLTLKNNIEAQDVTIETIVAGGSPTFPIHNKRKGVETSPGTTILWDAGYGKKFKDMKFLPAAVLFTRVVSKPTDKLLCLDLGHKSVASEMPFPRVAFLNLKEVKQISQSEEHLVLETDASEEYRIGETAYALPIHICPTVIKYSKVWTVEQHKITGAWDIAARDHIVLD